MERDGTLMLAHEADHVERMPQPGEQADIGIINLATKSSRK